MRGGPRLGQFTAFVTAALVVISMAVPSISADQTRLRLAGPAWMLSDDNPLKRGLDYDGAVEVEVPGVRYDPPVEVPLERIGLTHPTAEPDVDQILAHLRNDLGLDGRMLVHGVAYIGDVLVVLAMVEEAELEPRTVFALVDIPGRGWQHSVAAMDEPMIEVIHEGWREGSRIEVVPHSATSLD